MLQDWLSLFLRWAHIVAAIGWIGSSFYFMWLDSSLKRAANLPDGVKGENWTVHGGGFYHTVKYMVAPEKMPDDLHWFRWESYSTWMTGFGLLVVTYWWGAERMLIDPAVADIAPAQAIAVSAFSLVAAWAFYDWLCKSPLKETPQRLFLVLFAAICAGAFLLGQVLSARAAFLHVGAMIATIMSANVFLVIIPNQRVVVADLKAGRAPDPRFGAIAKLRSTHNNYLTLPVIFMMISNHYPMTFGHAWSVVIVAAALALGTIIRNWFNRYEAGEDGPRVRWQWPVAAAVAVFLMMFGSWRPDDGSVAVARAVTTPEAHSVVTRHCAACHAPRPSHEAFDAPAAGLMLHTPELLKRHAPDVLAQAVLSHAMPLGNETGMTEEERALLGAWIGAGTPDS